MAGNVPYYIYKMPFFRNSKTKSDQSYNGLGQCEVEIKQSNMPIKAKSVRITKWFLRLSQANRILLCHVSIALPMRQCSHAVFYLRDKIFKSKIPRQKAPTQRELNHLLLCTQHQFVPAPKKLQQEHHTHWEQLTPKQCQR